MPSKQSPWIILTVIIAAILAPQERATAQFAEVAVQLAKYGGPAAMYAGGFLLEKGLLDGVFDSVTGRPNVALLESRLKSLESNVALKSEMQEAVRSFRLEINERVTRQELESKLTGLHDKLVIIHKRLENLEIDREIHQVRLDDLENKTRNGNNPQFFVDRGNRFLREGDGIRGLANFGAALRSDDNCINAYLSRALYHLNLNAIEVAGIDYTVALHFDGSSATAQLGRATVLFNLEKWDEAIVAATVAAKDKSLEFDASLSSRPVICL